MGEIRRLVQHEAAAVGGFIRAKVGRILRVERIAGTEAHGDGLVMLIRALHGEGDAGQVQIAHVFQTQIGLVIAQLQLDQLGGVTKRAYIDVHSAGIAAVLRNAGDDAAAPALAHHPGLVGRAGDGGDAFIGGCPRHVVVGGLLGLQHGVQRPVVVHAHPGVRRIEVNPCHGDDHLHGCGGLTSGAVCRGGRNGGLSGSQRRHHAVFVHGNLFRIVGLVGNRLVGGILRADGDGQLRRLPQNDAVFLLSECHGLGQPNHLYLNGASHFRHFGAGGGDRDRAGAKSLHPSVLIHRGNAFIGGSPR